MFLIGAAIGVMVLTFDVRSSAPDRRQRRMSETQAIGYRAALGDAPPQRERATSAPS